LHLEEFCLPHYNPDAIIIGSLTFNLDSDGDGFLPPADCDDTNSTIFPGASEIIGDGIDQDCNGADKTPLDAIDEVIAKVETLVNDGVINNGNGNALILKLENAANKIDNGNTNAAANQLNAFINQINDFVDSGKLTSQQGQDLVDAIQAIIDSL